MFLDPMDDCPDKLVWALCGWLAWCDNASTYKEALMELRNLLDYRLQEYPEPKAENNNVL